MQDVGRNNAANLPLLKTVFDINLQLFQKEKRAKTLLLFIVRDHVRQTTALDKLVAIIEKDLNDIWVSIPKQDPFKQSKLTDFFELSFTSLPHKELQADLFKEELANLADRFNNPKNPSYIWSREFKGNVPADGFAHYASTIWEAIMANKDLDLPSQREMLAMFRCDEIAAEAYQVFSQTLQADILPPLAAKTILSDFGVRCAAMLKLALDSFSTHAEHYHTTVVSKKRGVLQESLLKDLKDAWNTHVVLLSEEALRNFDRSLHEAFSDTDTDQGVTKDFGVVVRALKKVVLDEFVAAVASSIPDDAGWDYALHVEQLEAKMNTAVQHEKERQMQKVQEAADKGLEGYGQTVHEYFELGRPTMWKDVRKEYAQVSTGLFEEVRGKLSTFGITKDDLKARMDALQAKLIAATKKHVEGQHARLDQRIEKAFDAAFKMGPEGIPRTWKPGVDLVPLMAQGRLAARKVIDRYAILRVDEADDAYTVFEAAADEGVAAVDSKVEAPPAANKKVPPAKLLLSQGRVGALEDHLTTYSNLACKDAQSAIDSYGTQGNTPYVVVVLMILLGWNELMWVAGQMLSSPLLFMFVVTCASGFYAIYTLGMLPYLTPVVNGLLNQVISQGQGLVRDGIARVQGASTAAGPRKKKAD